MSSRVVRFLYERRAWLKPFVMVRRPIAVQMHGFQLYVGLDDWAVGARIAVKRSYEPHVTAAMCPLLMPGKVFLDVGANIGYYTLLAASRVGDRGKVIAFEPAAENQTLLRRSLAANRLNNVDLHPFAVADVNGIVGYGMDDSNGRVDPGDPAASPLQVSAVTLDTFLANEPRIDVVKMDIEGAEDRALRGMSSVIRRHRPIIFTEFSPAGLRSASGISPEVYLNQLREPGYDLVVIPKTGLPTVAMSNEEIMSYFSRSGATDHVDLLARPQPL